MNAHDPSANTRSPSNSKFFRWARTHPALAVALLLAVVVPTLAALILPLRDERQRLVVRIVDLEERIARLQTQIVRIPPEQEAIQRAKENLKQSHLLVEGNSASVAGAELQRRLGQLAQETDGRLLQAEPLNTTLVVAGEGETAMGSSPTGYERLALRVRLQGGIFFLTDMLRKTSLKLPHIHVEKIVISSYKNSKLRSISENSKIPELIILIEFSAFRPIAGIEN